MKRRIRTTATSFLLLLMMLATAACVRVNVQGTPDLRQLERLPERMERAVRNALPAVRFATYNTSLYSDEAGGLVKRLESGDADARNIAAVLPELAAASAERVAMHCPGRDGGYATRLTYGELDGRSDAIAAAALSSVSRPGPLTSWLAPARAWLSSFEAVAACLISSAPTFSPNVSGVSGRSIASATVTPSCVTLGPP